jgi:hypothetical protein
VAQPIFLSKLNGKITQKLGYSCNFQNTAQSKLSRSGGKFAQSGHPDRRGQTGLFDKASLLADHNIILPTFINYLYSCVCRYLAYLTLHVAYFKAETNTYINVLHTYEQNNSSMYYLHMYM